MDTRSVVLIMCCLFGGGQYFEGERMFFSIPDLYDFLRGKVKTSPLVAATGVARLESEEGGLLKHQSSYGKEQMSPEVDQHTPSVSA